MASGSQHRPKHNAAGFSLTNCSARTLNGAYAIDQMSKMDIIAIEQALILKNFSG